jgi:hypothetical protein
MGTSRTNLELTAEGDLSIRKSLTNVLVAVTALAAIVTIAMWQFYLFVTFKDQQEILDSQGGTHHMWWAVIAALVACFAGFILFSVFLRFDKSKEMHITQ